MKTAIIFAFFSFVFFTAPCSVMANESQNEQDVFNTEPMKPFEGQVIRSIHIRGLRWTKERAVRWLLSQKEGEKFSAQKWLKGIRKLYNTTILYYVHTNFVTVSNNQIDIDLDMKDRWTLLPFGTAQSGGGSYDLGGGVADVNFLGYFAQLTAGYAVFDNVASYDFNYYQEFFLDTEMMLGMDISKTGVPVTLQDNQGAGIGSYLWTREQQQILVGRRFEPNIRFLTYFETFEDVINQNDQAPEVTVYGGTQYRLRPILIIGRSDWTNFLEQGYEFTLAPTTANFFNGSRSYSQFVTSYKRTMIDKNTNYALYVSGGVMTSAPIPYLFHLGGYDTIRGFSTFRALGEYYLENNLEYRPYLTRITFPLIGEVVVQGTLFQDVGSMWNSSDLAQTTRVNSHLFLLSEGVGLRLNLLRFAGCIVRIDLAKTITPDEGMGLSLGVGQFF